MVAAPGKRSAVERSFERLYRRHVGEVYRYAMAVLASPADAEDVTQTTFLNAYRAFERGQRPERPRNWLVAIAHNVCRQRFRQAARRPGEVTLDDEDVADVLVEDETPELDDVRIALSRLALNQRAALVLREVEGYSYAEIAETLGLSLSAVETLIFRARRALREQLESTLSCRDAERAISCQLDGALSRREKGALRAHLRACAECDTLARAMRAQRSGLKAFAFIPLPSSLTSFLGGTTAAGAGAATVGGGFAIKAATVGAVALLLSGGGFEALDHKVWHGSRHPHPNALSRVRQQTPSGPARAMGAEQGAPSTPSSTNVLRNASVERPLKAPQMPNAPMKARAAPAGGESALADLGRAPADNGHAAMAHAHSVVVAHGNSNHAAPHAHRASTSARAAETQKAHAANPSAKPAGKSSGHPSSRSVKAATKQRVTATAQCLPSSGEAPAPTCPASTGSAPPPSSGGDPRGKSSNSQSEQSAHAAPQSQPGTK